MSVTNNRLHDGFMDSRQHHTSPDVLQYITEVTPLKMPGNRKNVSLIVGYETKEKQFKKAIINLIYFKYIVITWKW